MRSREKKRFQEDPFSRGGPLKGHCPTELLIFSGCIHVYPRHVFTYMYMYFDDPTISLPKKRFFQCILILFKLFTTDLFVRIDCFRVVPKKSIICHKMSFSPVIKASAVFEGV